MKYYQSKTAKFLTGRGFYFVIACCMVAIGFAAYSAMDVVNKEDMTDKPSSSDSEYTVPAPEISEPPAVSIEPPVAVQNNSATESNNTPVQAPAAATVFIMPISGGVAKDYSENTLQYSATYKDLRLHTGVDLLPNGDESVKSSAAGKVAAVDENTILGTVVTVDHGDGVLFRYCGLGKLAVSVGDEITAGQIIGTLGAVNCECADSAHLHLEAQKNGTPVSPLELIAG